MEPAPLFDESLVRYSDEEGNVCYYSNLTKIDFNQTETYISLLRLLEENKVSYYSHLEFKDVQAVADALQYYRLEVLPLEWQIIVAIIYTLTAITSFILNALTLLILVRGRRTELRNYLINLSISDLMMSLFSIPFTYLDYMLGRWVLPNFLCPIIKFVVTLSVFVSIATMIVIGLNRYWAIVHPLKRAGSSIWWRIFFEKNCTIGWIWLVGVAVSIPEYLVNDVTTFCYRRHPNSKVELYWSCSYIGPPNYLYEIFIFLFTFVLPLLLLTYLYSAIALKLWRRRMPGNVDADRDSSALTTRKKVIKMLSVIVIFFALHWLPIQMFILISTVSPGVRSTLQDTPSYYIYVGTYFVSHWISMAHSCLNPLILYFMNDDFRSDLRCLLSARNSIRRAKVVCPMVLDSSISVEKPLTKQSYLGSRIVHHKTGGGGGAASATSSTLGFSRQLASALPGGAMCPSVVISFVVESRLDSELAASRCKASTITGFST